MVQRISRPSTTGLPAPEIAGAAGTAPPADAPREVATGADTPTDMRYENLDPNTVAALSQPHEGSTPIDPTNIGLTASELAAKHERTLKPLEFKQVPAAPVVDAAIPPGYERVAGTDLFRLIPTPAAPVAIAEPPPVPAALPPIEAHQVAGSNSDSPSRGVPREITDPGKVITGGFGSPGGQAMYYPLDGAELRELVTSVLVPHLLSRLADDLRFQMAITYPRVGVVLELRVDGYPDDNAFAVGETEVVARVRRAEVAGEGEDQVRTAPDQFRAEAGLAIPRMQSVPAGGGAGNRVIVDVVDPPRGGVGAVTR